MSGFLKAFLYFYTVADVCCINQGAWLPCTFTDEHVSLKTEKQYNDVIDTQLVHRSAVLQFGNNGDPPVGAGVVTFLVTASKLDLQKSTDGMAPDELECEIRRYSTAGIHVRWPALGADGYNLWFTCTLKHSKSNLLLTSILRQPSDQPPPGQQDYHSWPTIADGDTVTTTVAMVIKSLTHSVKARLGSQQRLHCQFSVDHRAPNVTVEWHRQQRGERQRLFSHNSRSGHSQGSGVSVKALATGDASYTLPFAKIASGGNYICSVSVNPLFASADLSLTIEEPPQVSLNVGKVLTLEEGTEQKVVCEAAGYFPLDVHFTWVEQDPGAAGQRVGAPLPRTLQNVLMSSHKHNRDQTYAISAFFYLKASLAQSGKQFTCSVSHQSLRVPIKKSFILQVEEKTSWMFILSVSLLIIFLLIVLVKMLSFLHRARRESKKPY